MCTVGGFQHSQFDTLSKLHLQSFEYPFHLAIALKFTVELYMLITSKVVHLCWILFARRNEKEETMLLELQFLWCFYFCLCTQCSFSDRPIVEGGGGGARGLWSLNTFRPLEIFEDGKNDQDDVTFAHIPSCHLEIRPDHSPWFVKRNPMWGWGDKIYEQIGSSLMPFSLPELSVIDW